MCRCVVLRSNGSSYFIPLEYFSQQQPLVDPVLMFTYLPAEYLRSRTAPSHCTHKYCGFATSLHRPCARMSVNIEEIILEFAYDLIKFAKTNLPTYLST